MLRSTTVGTEFSGGVPGYSAIDAAAAGYTNNTRGAFIVFQFVNRHASAVVRLLSPDQADPTVGAPNPANTLAVEVRAGEASPRLRFNPDQAKSKVWLKSDTAATPIDVFTETVIRGNG